MQRRHRTLLAALVAVLALGTVAAVPASGPTHGGTVIVGAGDIAGCDWHEDELTAQLLDEIPGTVITLGDNAYPEGTDAEFRECYGPTWGRHTERTRPAVGSRDYATEGAAGYFRYFGAAAGPPGRGYYAYGLGPHWQAIVLNSECAEVGGCGPGSAQFRWLAGALADTSDSHILVYWHRPRFSSGMNGDDPRTKPFWDLLYAAGVELVLNGHEHTYERFARQDPGGRPDPHGIRQFIVGTGGAPLYPRAVDRVPFLRQILPRRPTSEAFHATTHGVLRLDLGSTSYDWEFIPAAGYSYRDSGTTRTR